MLEQEMREVSQAYMGQLQQAVKASRELDAYLEDTRAFLEGLKVEVNTTVDALMGFARQAENGLVARRETVESEVSALTANVVEPMDAVVREAESASAQVEAEVKRALDELKAQAESFNSAAAEQARQAQGFLDQMGSQVRNLQGEMSSQFQEASDRVRELSAFIESTQGHWDSVVQGAMQQVQQAQQQCTTTLEQDFVAHVADSLQAFDSALKLIDAQVLRDPIGSLKNEATQMIDQQVQAVFDAALEELLQLVDQLADRILGASDRTDAETRALNEVIDKLKEFFGPLMDRVGGVKGVASAVGYGGL